MRGGAPASSAEEETEEASMPRDIQEASGNAGATPRDIQELSGDMGAALPRTGEEQREEACGEVGAAPPGTEQERKEEISSEGETLEENWTRFLRSESLRRSFGGAVEDEKELQVTERSNLEVARSYFGDGLLACSEARNG